MQVPRGEAPPPLDVLRWWFTLNDEDIRASEGRDAFELAGHGVRVQSENEMLSALGQRVHTGKSEPLNQQFAQSFTEHFAALAAKYPVYADLENIFDLALVGALIKSQDLADRAGWHLTCFGDSSAYPVGLRPAPKTVETVINHRVINQVHIIAGVSGGVHVDPWHSVTAEAIQVDKAALPERASLRHTASASEQRLVVGLTVRRAERSDLGLGWRGATLSDQRFGLAIGRSAGSSVGPSPIPPADAWPIASRRRFSHQASSTPTTATQITTVNTTSLPRIHLAT